MGARGTEAEAAHQEAAQRNRWKRRRSRGTMGSDVHPTECFLDKDNICHRTLEDWTTGVVPFDPAMVSWCDGVIRGRVPVLTG